MINSRSVAVYPPETTLIPVASTISFETFFWCISMCIATLLLILLFNLIYGGNDGE
jgi:hypothetical protein